MREIVTEEISTVIVLDVEPSQNIIMPESETASIVTERSELTIISEMQQGPPGASDLEAFQGDPLTSYLLSRG